MISTNCIHITRLQLLKKPLDFYVHTVGTLLYLTSQSTVRTAVEGLARMCYEWQVG